MSESRRGGTGERRELSLAPEHFEVSEGEVRVKSEQLERALKDADLGPGADLARGDVSVGVVVSRSF
jgi:hypothetical protein